MVDLAIFIIVLLCCLITFFKKIFNYKTILYIFIFGFLISAIIVTYVILVKKFNLMEIYLNFEDLFKFNTQFCIMIDVEFNRHSLLMTQLIFITSLFLLIYINYNGFDKEECIFYMSHICYFSLSILLLVNSFSIVTLYAAWVCIGLESIFLVSFSLLKQNTSVKIIITMILVNQIGDVLLFILFYYLWNECQIVEIRTINAMVASLLSIENIQIYTWFINLADFVSFVIIFIAFMKFFQLGFHLWLLNIPKVLTNAVIVIHAAVLIIVSIFFLLQMTHILILSESALNFLSYLGVFIVITSMLNSLLIVELYFFFINFIIHSTGYLFILLGYANFDKLYTLIFIHGYIKIFLFIAAMSIIKFFKNNKKIRHMGYIILKMPFIWFTCLFICFCLLGSAIIGSYYCKLSVLLMILFTKSINADINAHITTLWLIKYIYFFSFLYPVVFMVNIFYYDALNISIKSHYNMYVVQKSNNFTLVFLIYVVSFITFFGSWLISLLYLLDSFSLIYLNRYNFKINISDTSFPNIKTIDIPAIFWWSIGYLCLVFYCLYFVMNYFSKNNVRNIAVCIYCGLLYYLFFILFSKISLFIYLSFSFILGCSVIWASYIR